MRSIDVERHSVVVYIVCSTGPDAEGDISDELRHWDGMAVESGYTVTRDGTVLDTSTDTYGEGSAEQLEKACKKIQKFTAELR